MSIIIEKIVAHTDSGVRAIVNHAGQKLDVGVAGPIGRIADVLGQSLTVEVGYSAVADWRILEHDSESAHGLFQVDGQAGDVRVVGRVHNVLTIDDSRSVFDVYTQAGPEYLAFDSADISGRQPKIGDPISATLHDLYFYPTWT